jgi:hypothetical protein
LLSSYERSIYKENLTCYFLFDLFDLINNVHSYSGPLLSPILGGNLVQTVTWVGDEALLIVRNNDIYYQVGFFEL